jgi:hypothetical protein
MQARWLLCATGLLLMAMPARAQVVGGVLHVNNQHMS